MKNLKHILVLTKVNLIEIEHRDLHFEQSSWKKWLGFDITRMNSSGYISSKLKKFNLFLAC